MDSMTISFDIKGMVNGKYLIVASAIAVTVSYAITSARDIFTKWVSMRESTPKVPPPSSTISGSIIEDYKVNV
ncbi:hypothetical protein F-M6_0175 [Faustovirus]|nr:hypothetical protein F-LCD7_0174 [Faustovirus]QJX71938.1 hypothetical protein F-M6_0175 [Faustovirus]QJX72935.1 hypothetical protein F-VV57_0173 [Faustovirus]QJX73440.1 hypothetical protein F-VV63_0174 [Faustovirus]SMH63279.1 Hypothetical protein FSTVLC9_244 [Faustovirus]